MTGGYWLVAKTKPQRELWAAENAQRQGFNCYLPQTAPPERAPKQKARAHFLFPRYLFVYTEGRWRCLLSTFGIAGLVMAGECPAVMPPREIERIKAREDEHGLVRLAQAPTARFKEGDAVRVREGTFSGFTGIYANHSSHDRVKVLIEYLGRTVPVLLGEDLLELA